MVLDRDGGILLSHIAHVLEELVGLGFEDGDWVRGRYERGLPGGRWIQRGRGRLTPE